MSDQTETKGGGGLGAGAISTLWVCTAAHLVIQNTERVVFKFLMFSFEWPLWLYTIVVALIGALIWSGLGVMRRHRRRKERRAERRTDTTGCATRLRLDAGRGGNLV